jgi:hypothetical protein
MPPENFLHDRERRERPKDDLALLLWLARVGSWFGSRGWRGLRATAIAAVLVGRVELL